MCQVVRRSIYSSKCCHYQALSESCSTACTPASTNLISLTPGDRTADATLCRGYTNEPFGPVKPRSGKCDSDVQWSVLEVLREWGVQKTREKGTTFYCRH